MSVIEERTPEQVHKLIHKKSLGAVIGLNFSYFQGGDVQTLGFPDAQSENLLGFNFLLAGHFNLPIGPTTVLELSAIKRALKVSGDVEFITGGGVQQTELVEKGYALGAFAKFYGRRHSISHYGIGVEAFQVTDVEITVNGGQSLVYDGEKEIYLAPILGLGWDIQLTDQAFLSPEFRLGGFVTRSPIAIFADFRIVGNFAM